MFKKVIVLVALLVISSTPLLAVQRVVLAEDFTGTWCQYCPGAQMGLQILQGQVRDSLAILAYHLSDPFTIPECNTRSTYYGVGGIPHVKFDGVLTRIGGYYNQPVNYRDLYDARQAVSAPVQITLSNATFNPSSGIGNVSVNVSNVSSGNINGNLRLVMVGKDTTYSWQSQTHLYDVVLGMFPNAAAGAPVALHPGETFSQNYNYTIPAAWRQMACAIVAFLQDDVTKEIYNASEADTRTGIEETNFAHRTTPLLKVFPNPFISSLVISNASSRVNIYSVTGRLVKSIAPANNQVIWNSTDETGHKVNPGIYFVETAKSRVKVLKAE